MKEGEVNLLDVFIMIFLLLRLRIIIKNKREYTSNLYLKVTTKLLKKLRGAYIF